MIPKVGDIVRRTQRGGLYSSHLVGWTAKVLNITKHENRTVVEIECEGEWAISHLCRNFELVPRKTLIGGKLL